MITLRNVCKTYDSRQGEVVALKDVGFEVDDREFVTIVGPSGCGKTTLLKLIVGLIPTTEGEIYFGDELVDGPRVDVGMVFQQPILLEWRKVLNNVLFPIEILQRSRQEYKDEACDLLNLVGLKQFKDRYPWELSGGMQQRVAICRALIHDPTLLAMDEPFGALDAMTREEMGIELLRIWREKRKTVVFVTHSIREAVLLADRVVVLTERPGCVADLIEIDLPRPRSKDMEYTPEFDEYVRKINELIFRIPEGVKG